MKKSLLYIVAFTFILFSCNQPNKSTIPFKQAYQNYLNNLSEDQLKKLKVIKTIPEFSLYTLSGKNIEIGTNMQKTTVLVFFATWCPACERALPEIDSKIGGKWGDKINLLAIGREHNMDDLKLWSQKSNIKMEVTEDPQRFIYSKFANQSIPRVYVTDKNGNVIFQSTGWKSDIINWIDQAIESLNENAI